MDLTPYLNDLREDLVAAASFGDEETRRTAARLSTALDSSARLAILHALSDLAAEITGQLADHAVDVSLDGRDVRVTVTAHGRPAAPAGPPAPPPPPSALRMTKDAADGASDGDDGLDPADLRRAVQDAGGELSRTTVRLFNELKNQAERAAADQGVSLNTYISRAVSDSVRTAVPGKASGAAGRHGGTTITGFVQA